MNADNPYRESSGGSLSRAKRRGVTGAASEQLHLGPPRSKFRPSPVILLGVTVDQSLKLLRGQPQFLASEGWKVHVVSAGDSDRSAEFYLGPVENIEVHRLGMKRDPTPFSDAHSFALWLRLLRRIRPDVVCLGTPKASLLGLSAARMLGIPTRIYILRGLRLEGERGLRRHLLRMFERLTAAMSTHVVAVGESLRQVAAAEGIGGGTPLEVIGQGSSNGIEILPDDERDALRSQRDDLLRSVGLDPGALVIGYVGRLTPDKGVHLLVEACSALHELGVSVQLLLVGAEDSPHYQSQLTRSLQEGGLPHALTGYVERPRDFMAAMDIFCLPSLREGMPNVSLEAASLGLPVVTTEATGCRDSILPGISGLTFKQGDVSSLTSALRALVEDDAMRKSFGEIGSRWVAENFDRTVVWSLYEEFYRHAGHWQWA